MTMKITMNNENKKHTIYDSGFDRLLNRKDVVEENERQFQARIKEERDENERRERIRIQRIAANGKDPLLYSIDEIIRKCVIHQGGEQIEIPLQDLGFQYSIAGAVEAHRFFNQLRDAECFESVERSANVYFHVAKPNIEKLKEHKSKLENQLEQHVVPNQKQKVDFDPLNCVLRYGIATHAFHKGHRGEGLRIRLFKKLWEERRHLKNGKKVKEGKLFPSEALAVQLDIVSSPSVFIRDQKEKSKFFGLIKGINRILKDKKFPAEIERHNGILMVVAEK